MSAFRRLTTFDPLLDDRRDSRPAMDLRRQPQCCTPGAMKRRILIRRLNFPDASTSHRCSSRSCSAERSHHRTSHATGAAFRRVVRMHFRSGSVSGNYSVIQCSSARDVGVEIEARGIPFGSLKTTCENSSSRSSHIRHKWRRKPVDLAGRRQSRRDPFTAALILNTAVDLPNPSHLTGRQAIRSVARTCTRARQGRTCMLFGSVTVRSRTPSAASQAAMAASVINFNLSGVSGSIRVRRRLLMSTPRRLHASG